MPLSFRFRSAVRATGSVQTFVGNEKSFDGLAVHNVRLNDLFHIVRCYASIPDPVRINDHRGSVLALIEAPGHIRAHSLLKSAQRQLLFEEELQLGLALRIAATARMSRLALVAANEQVLLELGHKFTVQDFGENIGSRGCGQRVKATRVDAPCLEHPPAFLSGET